MACWVLEFLELLELGDVVFSLRFFRSFGCFFEFWNWEMMCLVSAFVGFLELK